MLFWESRVPYSHTVHPPRRRHGQEQQGSHAKWIREHRQLTLKRFLITLIDEDKYLQNIFNGANITLFDFQLYAKLE